MKSLDSWWSRFRTKLGFKSKPEIFWTRFDQARLLISRLNDEELFSPEAARLLEEPPQDRLHGCCLLFRAYALVSAKASRLMDHGFELAPQWERASASLIEHLSQHLFTQLRGDDNLELLAAMRMITLDVVRLPEVANVWAEGMDFVILSCGVVPVRLTETRPEVLVLRNFNHWDFPKGCVEGSEEPLVCALRETQEEAGLTQVEFKWGQDFYETEPYGKPRKTARYYVGQVPVDSEVKILPNPSTGRVEHQEYRWCGFDEARGLLKPRIQHALDFAQKLVEM